MVVGRGIRDFNFLLVPSDREPTTSFYTVYFFCKITRDRVIIIQSLHLE